ncbi:MAG: hypothetical protein IJ301_00495 [Clostridia bacterium]|nr:hypothetical protein [Clostridia bacterium]
MNEPYGISKLKQVLINDKHFNPERLNEVVSSDIFKILQNYMEINREDMLARIDIDEQGNYVLRCKVKCKRLKIMGLLS